jgi:hypothetical protein
MSTEIDATEERLDPKVWWIWITEDGIVLVGVLLLAAAIVLVFPDVMVIAVLATAIIAAVILLNMILHGAGVRAWRLQQRQDEIIIEQGVLVRETILLPMNRVQHIDTHQGPLERAFGLQSLRIATAAEIIRIPSLLPARAAALQRSIIEYIKKNPRDV